MALRTRNNALLAKIETTEGTDAGPVPGTDAVLVENPQISFNPNTVQTNESTGSLDGRGPITGGMTVQLTFDVLLKGSGTPGTPPEWGDLMRAAGWAEVITAAAVPAVPEAATAGTTSSLTLGSGASGTAQAYRGMPLLLTGNPAAGATSFVADYTAGKLATLADLFGTALSTGTSYQVPVNVLYRPASTNIPSLTFYFYQDGVLYKVVGARGNATLKLQSGNIGRISFTFTGMFVSKTDASVPTGLVYDATRPPVWKGGKALVNRVASAMAAMSIEFGNQMTNPDNPNAAEGFDPSIITARNMTGSCDPLETLIATRDSMAALRAGTQQIIHASYGTAAGNRIGLTVPAAFYTNLQPGDRNGLLTNTHQFACTGQDAGAFLCLF
ncbi:hypothetical protein TSH100_13830 [Azospirillum sp. TSH100]|uniref:hypothetical protein n=1 Tax=Azospirillum sp. TSH100 TaxID=652764 RepID=UPI000D60BE05|nr:hypothetical protein [Azospirillum sp. TSH100]PWC86050.1 hypothetical protein TSH100_13830 [Azospirillum sp. TSH100]QCG89375.1 hypothetical protein E6C72_16425 [Azospirillum sp. TSH100]